MAMLYPIVLETEDNGAASAYVPGLPVYVATDSHAKAERAIRAGSDRISERARRQPAGRTRPSHGVRINGGRESASLALRPWWGESGATRRHVPHAPTPRLVGRPPKASTNRTARMKTSR